MDSQNGNFTWRYRNKVKLERTLSARPCHFTPYLAGETFYSSQYRKWSSTDLYARCQFPAGNHIVFDAYYEHKNNTGKKPNRESNYFGLALYLFFSLEINYRSPGQSTKAEVRSR
jgi:hypothetical protein